MNKFQRLIQRLRAKRADLDTMTDAIDHVMKQKRPGITDPSRERWERGE